MGWEFINPTRLGWIEKEKGVEEKEKGKFKSHCLDVKKWGKGLRVFGSLFLIPPNWENLGGK